MQNAQTTQTKTFADMSACYRAAKKELGNKDAKRGVDYNIDPVIIAGQPDKRGWRWTKIEAQAVAAAVEAAAAQATKPLIGDGLTKAFSEAARSAPQTPAKIELRLFNSRKDAIKDAVLQLNRSINPDEDIVLKRTGRGEWFWRTHEQAAEEQRKRASRATQSPPTSPSSGRDKANTVSHHGVSRST
jgi:hypothetical protein